MKRIKYFLQIFLYVSIVYLWGISLDCPKRIDRQRENNNKQFINTHRMCWQQFFKKENVVKYCKIKRGQKDLPKKEICHPNPKKIIANFLLLRIL